jgi:dsDNA-specific endonuclease/ATPase MutS2
VQPNFEDEVVEVPITDVFDLHAFSPRDAKHALEAYLEEAVARGYRALRIVHGRGIGVQREMVRTVLSRTEGVIDYRDAPAETGGWGATIVSVNPDKQRSDGS